MSNLINQVIMWICVIGIYLLLFFDKSESGYIYSLILLIIVFLFAVIDMELIYTKKVN